MSNNPNAAADRQSGSTLQKARPNPEEMECVLPPQVVFLGEAMAPVAKSLRQAMKRRVRPSDKNFMLIEDLDRHMDLIQHGLRNLSVQIERLMSDVITNEKAGIAEANRAAGRFEQVISELVDGYLEANRETVEMTPFQKVEMPSDEESEDEEEDDTDE